MKVNKTKTNDSTLFGNCAKPLLANRLLKFRAWVKEKKRMIKVFGFNEHLVFEQTWDSPIIKQNIFEIQGCHIMQFTGFYDFDKKEIFEGDIISFTDVRDCIQKKKYQIYFNNECGSWYCKNGPELCNILVEQNNDDWKRSQNWNIKDNQYIRVIGNIYENPELIFKPK